MMTKEKNLVLKSDNIMYNYFCGKLKILLHLGKVKFPSFSCKPVVNSYTIYPSTPLTPPFLRKMFHVLENSISGL